MYEVHEVNDVGQLEQHRADWDRLLHETEHASFFHTLAWLKVYWQHFGASQQLRVLVIADSDAVVGIVPLVIRRERRRVGEVRIVTWPLDDWGSFYGPLGADSLELLATALRHLRNTDRDWDLLDLRWMEAGGTVARAGAQAMQEEGLRAYTRVRDKTAVIRTNMGWDAYLATRSSKCRNNLRRHQRKLAARGDLTYERYRPAGEAGGSCDPRWDLWNECIDVAECSWQGESTSGTTLSHDSIRGFLRDAHVAAATEGCLDVNLLRVDGRAIAFAYNYVYGGSVYGLRTGYDVDYASDGAGGVLVGRLIEDSCRRGDDMVDMGPGSLSAKKAYWTDVIDLVQVTHFQRRGLRAQALRWNATLSGQFRPVSTNDANVALHV